MCYCGSNSGLCTKTLYAQFQFILLQENDDCDALEQENLQVYHWILMVWLAIRRWCRNRIWIYI